MRDAVIVAGILIGLYLLKKQTDATAAAAAAGTIPTSGGISTAPTTSASYQTAPDSTRVMGYGWQDVPSASGTVPPAPPVAPPPPPFYGGTSGTVGTGGNPLGGVLRAGVSSGTGTTVVSSEARRGRGHF